MPWESDAQRKWANAAAARGEVSKEWVEESNQASKGQDLPERKKSRKDHQALRRVMEDRLRG